MTTLRPRREARSTGTTASVGGKGARQGEVVPSPDRCGVDRPAGASDVVFEYARMPEDDCRRQRPTTGPPKRYVIRRNRK